jgi:hypothetical protein
MLLSSTDIFLPEAREPSTAPCQLRADTFPLEEFNSKKVQKQSNRLGPESS